MTIALTTTKMLRYFEEMPMEPPGFFSGLFQAPPENFYESEEVAIDIIRSGEDIAVAIQDLSTGGNYNTFDKFDTKEFKPPVFKEDFSINAFNDTMHRQPGVNPFESPRYQANAIREFRRRARLVADKIRRSIELQAAQVMQTGKISLTDAASKVRYAIDYKPKSTHLPQVTTSWSTSATADPISDLASLAAVIRKDSKQEPKAILCGATAWRNAMRATKFIANFNYLNASIGQLVPNEKMGNGATYKGRIDVDNYSLDVYTYEAYYTSPAGTATAYMDANKVVMWAPDIRLDATFGNIPRIVENDRRVVPFIPPRIRIAGRGGVDLITNTWASLDGEMVWGRVGARPLMIPTQIDGFGCLNTVAA